MTSPYSPPRLLPYLVFLAMNYGTMLGESPEQDPTSLESRHQLSAQVTRNVEAGTHTMNAVGEKVRHLDQSSRDEFEFLANNVRSAERRLRRSLNRLEIASAEEWPHARATLANDYEAYAQWIGQAERLLTESRFVSRRTSSPR